MNDEIIPEAAPVPRQVPRREPRRTALLQLQPTPPDVGYVEPALLTVDQTCKLLNCGRTHVFSLLSTQKLERVKLGHATRISVRSIRSLLGA